MLYAQVKGIKSLATPGLSGVCPTCQKPVYSKCGVERLWHWAHKMKDCDPWHEPETEWHKKWKANFPIDWVERTITKNGILHRADVLTSKGICIEFQNSPISTKVIEQRESFYEKMIWVINGLHFIDNFAFQEYQSFENEPIYFPKYQPWTYKELSAYVIPKEKATELNELILSEQFKLDENTGNYWIPLSPFGPKEHAAINKKLDRFLSEKNLATAKRIRNVSFIWKRQKRVWNYAKMPIFIDFGENLIYLDNEDEFDLEWYTLYGKIVPKEMFLRKYLNRTQPS